MRQRLSDAVGLLPEWAAKCNSELLHECQDFLTWLRDDHFILLGSRDYEVENGEGGQ